MAPRKMRVFLIFLGILFFALTLSAFYIPTFYPYILKYRLEKMIVLMNPNDPKLFFEIGNSYFGQGKVYDIQKAETAFKKAVELRPDFLEAHYQLGRVYFVRGKFDSALIEIEKTLEINPEFKKTYYMYGLINGYKGSLEQAELGFQEYIKRDNFNWAGYNDLAWVYFRLGDFEKTRDTAKKGLEKAPNNPWLNNIYGTALLNLGKKNEAKTAFEDALKYSESLTAEDWGQSYPGNDPKIYEKGLEETRTVIKHNLQLVSE